MLTLLTSLFGKKTVPRRKSKTWKGWKLVKIVKSNKPEKKLMATFLNVNRGTTKTTHFGARGMSDYTIHKDYERMQRYNRRHKRNENWNNPLTAGSLSKWILWNKPSFRASVADYKKRFFK